MSTSLNVAFLFPGQGSQSVGMGEALCETYPVAREVFEEASDVLGFDMSALCFKDPESKLNLTAFTQPALLTASIAAWRALDFSPPVTSTWVAGHSLGEYTALVVAGALSFSDAVRIVHLRGQYMQEAVPEGEGAMAAIIGLKRNVVDAVCEKATIERGTVSSANYNSPTQVVISGRAAAVALAMELALAEGAKRAIQLAVSVPSHSPLMAKACARLEKDLSEVKGHKLKMPLINNFEAREITTWEDAKSGLVDQLASPLLWEETIALMQQKSVTQFLEVGPGRVLSGLLKRIDRRAPIANIESPAGIEKVRSLLNRPPDGSIL